MQITYKQSRDAWGIAGFIEGTKLVFSGEFTASQFRKEKIKQLLPFLKRSPKKDKGSIIKKVDIYPLLDREAKLAWKNAYLFAKKQSREVVVEDIFLSLLKTQEIQNLFKR